MATDPKAQPPGSPQAAVVRASSVPAEGATAAQLLTLIRELKKHIPELGERKKLDQQRYTTTKIFPQLTAPNTGDIYYLIPGSSITVTATVYSNHPETTHEVRLYAVAADGTETYVANSATDVAFASFGGVTFRWGFADVSIGLPTEAESVTYAIVAQVKANPDTHEKSKVVVEAIDPFA